MSVALALAATGALLVGDWAYVPALHDRSEPVTKCQTDNGVHYGADRRFATFNGDVRGTWQLTRAGLVERVTRRRAPGGRALRVWPTPTVTALRWLSPDHVNLLRPGAVQGLVRCRGAR